MQRESPEGRRPGNIPAQGNALGKGDLISVSQGKLIESFRTTGNKTDRSVGADLWTEWGSLNTDSAFGENAPTTKALREAAEKLVKEVSRKLN